MRDGQDLTYTTTEVRSYLPSGWNLVDSGAPGAWDARRGTWTTVVHDTAMTSWPLVVSAADAARLGRLEALRAAAGLTWRSCLG